MIAIPLHSALCEVAGYESFPQDNIKSDEDISLQRTNPTKIEERNAYTMLFDQLIAQPPRLFFMAVFLCIIRASTEMFQRHYPIPGINSLLRHCP